MPEQRALPVGHATRIANSIRELDRERFFQSIFDSSPTSGAVLDDLGFILAINLEWLHSDSVGIAGNHIGDNFLENCERLGGDLDNHHFAEIATGIRSVLLHLQDDFQIDYVANAKRYRVIAVPIHNPSEGVLIKHFEMNVRALACDSPSTMELLSERTESLAKVGGWAVNLRTQELLWTPGTYRLHDMEPGSPIDLESAIRFYSPAAQDVIRGAVERSMLDGTGFDLELPLLTASGREILIRTQGSVIYENGVPAHLVGAIQDITERSRTEAIRRGREHELRMITNHLPATISRLDRSMKYLFVNQPYERMFGISRAEIVGRTILEVHGEEYYREVEGAVRRALNGEQVTHHCQRRERDGVATYWLAQCIPELDESGEVCGVLTIAVDISERVIAEAATQEALTRLQKIASSLPGVVYKYRLSQDGFPSLPYISERVKELLGLNPGDLLQDASAINKTVHPEDEAAFTESIKRSALNQTIWNEEFRVRLADGTEKWLHGHSLPEREADGSTVWYGFVTDISQQKEEEAERKKYEEEKLRLESRLAQSQKLDSIGRLAGGVAHDFNNMLGIVLGHTELALKKVEAHESLREDLLQIQEAARRSAELTRQLLAFARRQTIDPQPLDVNQVVSGMLRLLPMLLGEDIQIDWKPAPELWSIEMDPTQLEQIVTNLCINSRDAIATVGNIAIRTSNANITNREAESIADAQPGDYVCLEVKDDGKGMCPETLRNIFEPFFTTKGGKGTGLGLATVHGSVRQNRGFVSVQSEVEKGTVFKIYLPRIECDGISKPEVKHDRPTHGDETILLVEDEPALLRLTKKILENKGYRILAASSPSAACKIAKEHSAPIHLLITDVIMPEMNGRDLADLLCNENPSLRCLFMSGYTSDVIAHRGSMEEETFFIEKPFSYDKLSEKIREVLDAL